MNYLKIFNLQKRLMPEITDIFNERYNILKNIEFRQPIGRRSLAEKINLTERVVRGEIEKLKDLGLVSVDNNGISVTTEGKNLMDELDKVMLDMRNINNLETRLKDILGIKKVYVIENLIEDEDGDKRYFGKHAASIIQKMIRNNDIIGIAGGTTMSAVAGQMKKSSLYSNVIVVPARGALNEELELQSNTIACEFAQSMNAEYKMLHIPDNLSEIELQAIKSNSSISDVLSIIERINVLIFGLGNAMKMAKRRKADKNVLELIKKENLVAETFGYFFDEEGKMKLQMNSVGININKIVNVENAVAVAAGSEKAEVIKAFSKFNKNYTLITDEMTARKIVNKHYI